MRAAACFCRIAVARVGVDLAHIYEGTLEAHQGGHPSVQGLPYRSGGGRGQGAILQLGHELRRAVASAFEVGLNVFCFFRWV